MNILRVNMNNRQIYLEPIPEQLMLLGNRSLIGEILTNEVPASCHPLGEKNKLILAGGPLAGLGISSADRLSAGAKSPLTGGIKEANAGGIAVQYMAKHGIRAIIIEGKPNADSTFLLRINNNQFELMVAEELKGMGNYEVAQVLRQKYGEKTAIITIGPAGEKELNTAGIFASDRSGIPSRACARGGLGAVMGSKKLKAIVIENNGDYKIPVVNMEDFKKARKKYLQVLQENPQTSEIYTKYGTASALATVNKIGGLPTNNYRYGSFEKAEQINGDTLYDLIEARGGEGLHSHACMSGCIIKCSNVVPDNDGKAIVTPLEFETLCLLGSNLGIGDIDFTARLNYLCNDLGIDTIEVGAAIGVALEAGVASFGDQEAVYDFIDRDIRNNTLLGRVLGQGAAMTGKVLGIKRIPVVKGQAMAAHEPRAIKGMSITYAMSPMGADHTAAVTLRAPVDHKDPKGQMELSRQIQVTVAAYDSLGFCMFVIPAIGKQPEHAVDLINAVYGLNLQYDWIENYGKKVLLTERNYNKLAGLTDAHDRLPEYMLEEKLPPSNAVSDIPLADYERFWNDEFWDIKDFSYNGEGHNDKQDEHISNC
ncbi:MAG: aldehyde ferredoxin oxidoreductase C-terminal domain-containing protein [Bacillota bacterium]|nr:aldehyde ferredoxin oxidoreductase C-terminal domain-containing protein [Bacillota bacterium]